jgi:hypothetical protein
MSQYSRRQVITRAAQMVAGLSMATIASKGSRAAATSCTDAGSASLRESLHYTDAASNPAEACGACGFFTASDGGCGSCTIMSGSVSAKGHCDSWSAKGS